MAERTLQSVKQINRNRVFRLIAARQRISKQEIAAELNLSLPTTTQNLNSLKEEGLVAENGTFSSNVGRKARALSIVPDYRVAIGLDITPHHISMVSADLNGSIIDHVREKFDLNVSDDCCNRLAEKIRGFIRKNEILEEKILGMGIAIPGIISFDRKEIISAETMPISRDFCEKLQQYFSFPCHLFNDASCAGVAEFWKKDYTDQNIAYLLLSNTVGGSILVDGKPFAGMGNRSAEFGHITIVPDGEICSCGKRGCAEAYCSALILSRFTDNNLADFFKEVNQGNEAYRKLVDQYLDNLAILVNDINMCLDIPLVLGGYMGPYLKPYLPRLQALVSERSTFPTDGSYLRACACEFEAAALGGALFYIEEFIKNV